MEKILIVDDEPDWIKMLTPRLESEGCEVVAAFDTITGISQINEAAPDLVLLDIMMPSGGGIKVLEYIRRTTKTFNLKVIVLTAKSDQTTRTEAEKLGVSGYFVKPIDTAEVLKRISEVLHPAAKPMEAYDHKNRQA